MSEFAVQMNNITVCFPGTVANDNVSLAVKKGEVFALVGENGAGKSTIMNVLYGLLEPSSGSVLINGQQVKNFSPDVAIKMGVGMVHQHFKLVPSFTVAQNIFLGNEPKKFGMFFDAKKAEDMTAALVNEYGLEVDPKAKVCDISVGLSQRVEILKTLSRGSKILILDEPTAVLTPKETTELFSVIRKLAHEKGNTVIIITHKLYEVMEISDRVGVMRKGKLIAVKETSQVTEKELASLMVGRDVLLDKIDRPNLNGEIIFEAKNICAVDNRGLPACRDISFNVRAGEILGIAGVEGNGQSELAQVISGMRSVSSGKVTLNGNDITGKSPDKIRGMGLSFVPEDRLKTGLSGTSSIAQNVIVGKHKNKPFAFFKVHKRNRPIAKYAQYICSKYDIRTSGIDIEASTLSGGNMQKLVIGREFSFENTKLLIIAQPTRGVDIGAIEFIHAQIIKKRNEGCGIILISADLDEVLRLSDRVIILFEGRVTSLLSGDELNKDTVGMYMLGDVLLSEQNADADSHGTVPHATKQQDDASVQYKSDAPSTVNVDSDSHGILQHATEKKNSKSARHKNQNGEQSIIIKLLHKIDFSYLTALFASIIIALLIGAIIMSVCGYDPIESYSGIVNGSLGSERVLGNTVAKSVTLCITALAMAVAAKAGMFNVGGEGQLFLGAISSALIGIYCTGLPPILVIALAMIGAAVAGALLSLIPAVLKVKLGVSEVIVTILLNTATINFCKFLASGPLKAQNGVISEGTELLPKTVWFDNLIPLSNLTSSLFVAIVLTVLVWYLMTKTTVGYEYNLTGQNSEFSKYSGLKTAKIAVVSMLISGAMCGLVGMFEVYGTTHRYLSTISKEFYFDGMLIAMIMRYNPIGIVPMSIFFAMLKIGAASTELKTGMPNELILVVQSIIIFFMAAENGITKAIKAKIAIMREKKKVKINARKVG